MTGQPGQRGGIARDNRKFINAVVWILKTGSPWGDLPPDYGKWGTVHQRFIRWQRKGMWKKLFEILKDDKNFFADRAHDTNEILSYIAKRNIKAVIPPKHNRLEQRDYKGFQVLKKRDNSLTVNFIALDMLSRIISSLLNVGAVLSLDTLKRSMVLSLLFMFVVYLCTCHSFNFFYVDSI